jgi:hypothetical protein
LLLLLLLPCSLAAACYLLLLLLLLPCSLAAAALAVALLPCCCPAPLLLLLLLPCALAAALAAACYLLLLLLLLPCCSCSCLQAPLSEQPALTTFTPCVSPHHQNLCIASRPGPGPEEESHAKSLERVQQTLPVGWQVTAVIQRVCGNRRHSACMR